MLPFGLIFCLCPKDTLGSIARGRWSFALVAYSAGKLNLFVKLVVDIDIKKGVTNKITPSTYCQSLCAVSVNLSTRSNLWLLAVA